MEIPILLQIFVLLFSVIIHEISHGYTALYFGDKTAEYEGRLTLNPISHIDLWGTIIIPLSLALIPGAPMIGWAKPVPYNPYNLRNQKIAEPLVALAGPASNFCLALIFGTLTRVLSTMPAYANSSLIGIFMFVTLVNITLGLFNLIPIPPLDGSKVLFSIFPLGGRFIFSELARWFGLILVFAVIIFAPGIISPLVSAVFFYITGIHISM
jgi:Zn-dependent protease